MTVTLAKPAGTVPEYGVHFWSRALHSYTVWRCVDLPTAQARLPEIRKHRDVDAYLVSRPGPPERWTSLNSSRGKAEAS